MVARAWPVSVEVIQDWLLAAPSQTSPTSCFYDTVIQSYVQLKSGSIERTAHFMGRPTP